MTELFIDPEIDRELIPCERVPFPGFTLFKKSLENVEFELTHESQVRVLFPVGADSRVG